MASLLLAAGALGYDKYALSFASGLTLRCVPYPMSPALSKSLITTQHLFATLTILPR